MQGESGIFEKIWREKSQGKKGGRKEKSPKDFGGLGVKRIIKSGLIGILVVVFLYALSWILTCGVIKLITLCFGIQFKWLIATGIWTIMCVVESIFKRG